MVDGLTPQTAVKRCNGKYTDRQIRRACAKGLKGEFGGIEGAELIGTTYYFTVAAFDKWLNTPDFHKTGKKVTK